MQILTAGWPGAARRAALGLRAELHPDFVFSAVIGTGVPHFHQHVFVRHAGTPAQYDRHAGDQWPDAARGTTPARWAPDRRRHG